MKKGSIFKKMLLYLICACLLTAVLSVIIYSFSGAEVYARRLADEMVPRAVGMARLASKYQTGQISFDSFVDFTLKEQEGCRVYIYDADGHLIAYSTEEKKQANQVHAQEIVQTILKNGYMEISTKWRSTLGIAVGVPITDNIQRVIGVILMTKPTNEVFESMRGLFMALLFAGFGGSTLMILPAYLASKRMSMPIRRMTQASIAMANGDFSVRADEDRNDEIGQLGQALNHLSAQLDTNIRDLVLARNRLHVILDGMHEGVIALDAVKEIVYWNPAALMLFDCKDAHVLREKLNQATSVLTAVTVDRKRRTLSLEESDKKLLLVISCSQESSEAAPGAVIVVQDVTAVERLEQTRKDYVANVSHELRTPIASIRSLAETLNDGLVKSEEDRSRYYGYILRESMRLARLINDLLELSRLQSGAVALEKQPFDLIALINEVTERMRLVASDSGISVERDVQGAGALMVYSNRDRIEQVLIALVDNAIKFAEDDGAIRLLTVDRGNLVHVSVCNTGRIGENDLAHLFERFYKADASHSDGGTGLGLAIVREVLTLLEETIEATNEGGFAVFRFTIHRSQLMELHEKS
ncbi:MAG: histidine kinase dimerization/phospho-acceptor domain-containing protein [Clostridia bacterium]